MKHTLLLLLLIFIFLNDSYGLNAQTAPIFSKRNLKNCTLLPVTDNQQGALAYKVYDAVDRALKQSTWCSYRANASILATFQQFGENLKDHLDRPELLQIVSQKLDVGSIFRLSLESQVGGHQLRLVVYGNEGQDVLFDEMIYYKGQELDLMTDRMLQWIDQYAKELPYDGVVAGVMGEQLSVDMGQSDKYKPNQTVLVKRLMGVKKHPLINKVVEYQTQVVAKGNVFNVGQGQLIALIKTMMMETPLLVGDWVVVEDKPYSLDESLSADDLKKNEFGKLGQASFLMQMGNISATSVTASNNKLEGLVYGISLSSDFWLTRKYFIRGVLERYTGNLDKASDETTADKLSTTPSVFKLALGYKILPMGYFWGPQIDFYTGYTNYSYPTQYDLTAGMGEGAFSGLSMGFAFNMPVTKKVRADIRSEILVLGDYNDGDNLYTNEESTTSLLFSLGGVYEWTPMLGLEGRMEVLSNKAKFSSSTYREIHYQSTLFKFGINYQY